MSAESDKEIDVKVTATTSGLAAGMAQARTQVAESVEQIKGHFETLNNAVSMVRNAFLAIGAVVAGGEMFEHTIEQTSQFAVQLEVLHEQTGMNVESLSALRYAAELSHVSFEALSTGLDRLAKNLYQAVITPTSSTSVALRELGIRAAEANGQLRPMEDLLLDVANRFHGMQDGTEKAAIAMSLFGRSGAQLIPFLNQGEAGIRALMERAKELGVTLDEDGVRTAIEYEDAVKDLEAEGRGLEQQLAIGLMPALTQIARAFTEGGDQANAFKDIIGYVADAARLVAASIIEVVGVVRVMNAITVQHATSLDEWRVAWQNAKNAIADTRKELNTILDTTGAIADVDKLLHPEVPGHTGASTGATSDAAARKREALADRGIEADRDAKLQALEIERDQLEKKRAMHQVSDDDYLAAQKALVEREYQVKREALEQERAAAEGNVEHQAQINDQLIQLETKHQHETSSLIVHNLDAAMKQVDASWKSMLDGVGSRLDKFASQSNTVFGRVLGYFVDMSGKMLLQHIATEEAKNMVTAQAWVTRLATEAAGYVTSAAMHLADALKWIATEAAKAAAATWTAIATIPYVGPFLAPAAAGAALAGVLALGKLASASGGYDIPAGVNPLTQLHAREMVLPAHLADAVRGMAGQGGAGAGSGGDGGNHFHGDIYAMDAQSFEAFLKRNGRALGNGVRQASRDGHLPRV